MAIFGETRVDAIGRKRAVRGATEKGGSPAISGVACSIAAVAGVARGIVIIGGAVKSVEKGDR